jgi:thiamine biosynthesis lipoprotein
VKPFLTFFLLVPLFFSCSNLPKEQMVRFQGLAQGTYYSVVYCDEELDNYQLEIDSLLVAFDQSVSLWKAGSIINRVNQGDTSRITDRWFVENFLISEQVAHETNGSFDITIGPLARAWGFGSNGVREVDSAIIDSLLHITGFGKVRLSDGYIIKDDPRIWFDFNAVAQGYSVDVVGVFLESKGIENYLVDIGGEIRGRGKKPDGSSWLVGIEKPADDQNDERTLSASLKLDNACLATSGNYRKYFEEDGMRYAHTIDPSTGYPARHTLLSATILCDSAAFADAYATACMVMGFEKAWDFVESRDDLEAFFIYSTSDGYEAVATPGFQNAIVDWYED